MLEKALSFGPYIFPFGEVSEPIAQDVRPTQAQIRRAQHVISSLGELGWGAQLLYAQEWLQNQNMPLKDRMAYHTKWNTYFKRYCPHLSKDITAMEVHSQMQALIAPYRPRLSKRDLQAVRLVYEDWKNLPEENLSQRRLKSWIERGLFMVMSSRCYLSALPKPKQEKAPRARRSGACK